MLFEDFISVGHCPPIIWLNQSGSLCTAGVLPRIQAIQQLDTIDAEGALVLYTRLLADLPSPPIDGPTPAGPSTAASAVASLGGVGGLGGEATDSSTAAAPTGSKRPRSEDGSGIPVPPGSSVPPLGSLPQRHLPRYTAR